MRCSRLALQSLQVELASLARSCATAAGATIPGTNRTSQGRARDLVSLASVCTRHPSQPHFCRYQRAGPSGKDRRLGRGKPSPPFRRSFGGPDSGPQSGVATADCRSEVKNCMPCSPRALPFAPLHQASSSGDVLMRLRAARLSDRARSAHTVP